MRPHRFSVGERARITCTVPGGRLNLPQFEGHITTICGLAFIENNRLHYTTLMPPGAPQVACENCLVPVYDGDEPAKWATCEWRPKELVV